VLRLYWHPFSIIPRRVRIALREKQIPHEEVEVDVLARAHKAPPFLRLNPFGQIPVLQDGDLVICESVAILEYLEERLPTPCLLSPDIAARAITRQYMLWSGDYLNEAWEKWIAPAIRPGAPYDVGARDEAHDAIAAHLDVLDRRLAARDWLVDEYSLADVCYAPVLTVLERVGLGHLVASRPAVAAWITRVKARPPVRETAPPDVPLSVPPRSLRQD